MFSASRVVAAQPMMMTDHTLTTSRIYVLAMDDQHLVYYDQQQRLRKLNLNKLVQLQSAGYRPLSLPNDIGLIEFADGQRLLGHLKARSNETKDTIATSFYWDSMIGVQTTPQNISVFDDRCERKPIVSSRYKRTIPVGLDDVRSIQFQHSPTPASNAQVTGDTITMQNGETLTGFILGFDADNLQLQQDSGQLLNVGLPQIASIRLLQDVSLCRADFTVELIDGSRLHAAKISFNKDTLRMKVSLTGQSEDELQLPITFLKQLRILKHGYQLMPLRKLPMTITKQSQVFGLQHSPTWTASNLKLHAPTNIRFKLPKHAVNFAATVRLDTTNPNEAPQVLKWANMRLTIQPELSTNPSILQIDAANQTHQIQIDLQASTWIELNLDQAANGPIMDRLRLDDAHVLIHNAQQTGGITHSGQSP